GAELRTCGPYLADKLTDLNAFLKKFHHHKATDRQVQQIAGQAGNNRPFEKLAPAVEKDERRRPAATMALYCVPFVRHWHKHARGAAKDVGTAPTQQDITNFWNGNSIAKAAVNASSQNFKDYILEVCNNLLDDWVPVTQVFFPGLVMTKLKGF